MSEPKTYYGPWFETIPTDAPNGSLWDAVYVLEDGDTIECQIVAFNGWLIDEDMITVDGGDISRARRIWPPGSVLPEPRSVLIDGKPRQEIEVCRHCMLRDDPRLEWVESHDIREDIQQLQKAGADLSEAAFYPVQPFNGALVPVPWPDSGCTTE